MPCKTALYDRHVALGARVVDFAGWLLPVQYEGILGEHGQCRASAVVFDTSHMGQFLLSGPDAADRLGRICTQDAATLRVGRCRYGFLLNEDGGVLDDTILMRLADERFLLVVNAGTLEADLEWLRSHLSGRVELINRSAEGWGKLDLQGPLSAQVLRPLIDPEGALGLDLSRLAYFGVAAAKVCGLQAVVSRTGYTGELGYEVMARGEDLPGLFDRLLESPAVRPAGLGARDSLRLEMCYPLYGHELDPQHTPVEAGLEAFVPLSALRPFVGAERLRQHIAAGTPRKLAAFRAESRRRAGAGNRILRDGRCVGAVTSAAFAPSLNSSVGMGYVDAALCRPGQELVVDTGRVELPVTVCARPLYTHGTCRADV